MSMGERSAGRSRSGYGSAGHGRAAAGLLFGVLLLLGLGAGCGQGGSGQQGAASGGAQPAANTGGPISVGHVASLTGDTAAFGQSSDRGMRMAIDELNAKGGVLGRQIEMLSEDDRSLTEEARTAAQKLIQRDQVVALLGEVASSRSLAAAPEAQRARVPMISEASTNPKVTEVGDYVFRACFIDPFQGAVMARFAHEDLKAKKVAILFDFRQDYSVGLAEFFRKTFKELGGEIVADERYTSGDIEFRAQLTTIRAANPEAIFIPGYYTEVGLIAKQARELGLTVPLLGGDGWDSEKTVEIGGEAIEGGFFSTHYASDSDNPRVQEFVSNYKAKYKSTPDAMAALGYDTVGLLVNALQRAGTTEGVKLRDAIASTSDFDGLTGRITMDPQRNARKDAVVIKIEGGQFRYHSTVPAS
jgi:branched-chain amino acid transport system substrate-binding protein